MEIANIRAQIANFTSQLSQHIEWTTMQGVPTFDWRDHSNSMWWEPQQVQHETYWQPYEEFYATPMQPPQPPPQEVQPNSGSSLDNDQTIQLLTSLAQKVQNQNQRLENRAKELGELKNQMGEIVEFIGQIQAQSELSSSMCKPSREEDEQLRLEEEEEDKATASLEEALPQPSKDPPPPNSSKISILSNLIPSNVPIPCRFNEEEGEKGIIETFPTIQEKKVVVDYLELIKDDVLATTIPNEVEFYDTGQVTTLQTTNMAEISNLQSFEVVFVLEFVLEHKGKPPPRISNSFYTNILLMIQAPTLEFKPLPVHFKYHCPFKDKGGIVRLEDVKGSASWEATHAFNKGRLREHSISRFAFLNLPPCCLYLAMFNCCLFACFCVNL